MRTQDFSLLANATEEVADVLERLVTQHPAVFNSLGIRYPLADELGGYAFMLRAHALQTQSVEAPKEHPIPKQPPGMAVQALAGEIIAALLADEEAGGYDLPSGIFGPNFSTLVRRWAAAEWNSLALTAQAPNEPIEVISSERDELITYLAACRDAMPDTHLDVNAAVAMPSAVPDYVRASVDQLVASRDTLLGALKQMNRAYVSLLETGRDRMVMHGGQCDRVDVMEANDPNLRASREIIAQAEGNGAPKSAAQQAQQADNAFSAYDFGQGVIVADADGWEYTIPGNERTRSVYVENEDAGPAPGWKLTFTARFDPETGALTDAYAMDGKGQVWGALPKRSAIELGVAKANPDFNADDVKAVAALQSSLLTRHVDEAAPVHKTDCYVIVKGEATEDEDEDVAGAYLVQLDLSRPVSEPGGVRHTFDEADHAEMATAVLNEFHEKLGISVLDDFEISVHLFGGDAINEAEEERDTGLVVSADFCGKVAESDLPFELSQTASQATGPTPGP